MTPHSKSSQEQPRIGRPPNDAETAIGERLQEARMENGFSQAKLAKLATTLLKKKLGVPADLRNVSRDVISSIERGEIEAPGCYIAGVLAQALGVKIDWLVFGDVTKYVKKSKSPRGISRRAGG